MKKLNTRDETNQIFERVLPELEKLNIDVAEDDYTIVQPFLDGQGIRIQVETDDNTGERELSVKVTDTMIVLPKINGYLDIFQSPEN